jgi:hypothetical protein
MKLSMTGQENVTPFNTGDCLIEVTAWAGLTVYTITLVNSRILHISSSNHKLLCFI